MGLQGAELEVASMIRKVQHLEADLESFEDKMLLAAQKLDVAATAADDNDRMRKVFESKCQADEERMSKVDSYLKDARNKADEADKQYDEISKKLQLTESELEKAAER